MHANAWVVSHIPFPQYALHSYPFTRCNMQMSESTFCDSSLCKVLVQPNDTEGFTSELPEKFYA